MSTGSVITTHLLILPSLESSGVDTKAITERVCNLVKKDYSFNGGEVLLLNHSTTEQTNLLIVEASRDHKK